MLDVVYLKKALLICILVDGVGAEVGNRALCRGYCSSGSPVGLLVREMYIVDREVLDKDAEWAQEAPVLRFTR